MLQSRARWTVSRPGQVEAMGAGAGQVSRKGPGAVSIVPALSLPPMCPSGVMRKRSGGLGAGQESKGRFSHLPPHPLPASPHLTLQTILPPLLCTKKNSRGAGPSLQGRALQGGGPEQWPHYLAPTGQWWWPTCPCAPEHRGPHPAFDPRGSRQRGDEVAFRQARLPASPLPHGAIPSSTSWGSLEAQEEKVGLET